MSDAPQRYTSDYLIIGSGIAGLSAALYAAEHGNVIVVTKKEIEDCNTSWAQGGIACVLDDEDSFDEHVQDTLKAGAGLCKEDVVRQIVEEGPARIKDLRKWGFQATLMSDITEDSADGEGLHLGREGGHSKRRVLHAGDITGREIIRTLRDACLKHDRITIQTDQQAVDLISSRRLGQDGPNQCLGAWMMDRKSYVINTYLSRFTILATGGAGKVYLYSSNPDVACGEGVSMAYRAYAEVANMEFYQFHPTILHHPKAKSFLISEAVRGEGAVLKMKRGGAYEEFMQDYHELGSLATRDIVARAIDRELKKSGQPCAYLDATHHDADFLRNRFPNIMDMCASIGIDMATDLIPVVPAAHYCCGGVRAEVSGATCVQGLYAVGEVACTGMHGANRLASNSLLEGLVMGAESVKHCESIRNDLNTRHLESDSTSIVRDWSCSDAKDPDELVVLSHNWDEIRRFMWDYVGIFRTDKRLQRAKNRVRNIRKEIELFYWNYTLTPDLIELRGMASVAEMIIDCAQARRESIGLHFNADCPPGVSGSGQKDNVLRRPGFERTLH